MYHYYCFLVLSNLFKIGFTDFTAHATVTDNKDDLKMPDYDEDTKAKITGKSSY